MNWLALSFQWYITLFLLGLTFLPLTLKLFHKYFWDKGYAFSKVIAIIILSYLSLTAGFFKILPFSRQTLFFLVALALILNFYLLKKNKNVLKRETFQIWLFEEFLFLISFLFWTYIRGQEPSIRGLEKFMDFGFINSILRTKYFPPLDMWLSADPNSPSGYPINYYYFGHLTAAFLIKLSGVSPFVGYNLILSTIFAFGITLAFSLSSNMVYTLAKVFKKQIKIKTLVLLGLFSSLLLNLGGNLHTIYILTKGYEAGKPLPFWKAPVAYSFKEIYGILKSYSFNPFSTLTYIIQNSKYWYPNATRFIPFTIHEFPSYSYVVADLHGHVLNIPYVLLTIAFLFLFFTNQNLMQKYKILLPLSLGFLISVLYMTNAFDGPIYFLFILILLFFSRLNPKEKFSFFIILLSGFFIFSFPFSSNFKPFVNGIGINCAPSFLTKAGKLGPFLFEKGNCQKSPFWMMFLLWGYFWLGALIFSVSLRQIKKKILYLPILLFIGLGFFYSIFLILIPEFFYLKDIYPAHFRANTMFKLGYQSFIISSLLYAPTLYLFKIYFKKDFVFYFLKTAFVLFSILVFIYPFFSAPSYYGKLNKKPELDGSIWLYSFYPQDKEIIDFLNKNVKGQPTILEAQGDSYTDYERISSYTGLPTVAGWFVHEWLWRGTPVFVSKRIPDIKTIYETSDPNLTFSLLQKYYVKYVIISTLEREKYPDLKEDKFYKIGKLIFQSSNKEGKIFEINYYL